MSEITVGKWSGPITTDQAIKELLAAFETMSHGQYGWGMHEAEVAVEFFAKNLSFGSGPCHMVYIADHPKSVIGPDPQRPEHVVTLCVTGNGPTSAANAQGLIRILTVLAALRAGGGKTQNANP